MLHCGENAESFEIISKLSPTTKLFCFCFGLFLPQKHMNRYHRYDTTWEKCLFFLFFMLMQNSFFYYPEKKKIPTFWACENAVKNTFKIFKCICNLILQPNIQFVFNVAYHFWCDITGNLLIKASSLMHTLPLWPMSSLKPFELRLNWIPLVVSVTACQFCVSWMEILL